MHVLVYTGHEQNAHLLPPHPVLVFVNSKSGTYQGARVLRAFLSIGLHPVQVVDIIEEGPRPR
jgi:hypothetical protein